MPTTAPTLELDLSRITSDDRFLNRELSWLDFNERVLAVAEDPALPLLERLKFVAIFAGNLDEFYQVRVATLRRQELAAPGLRSADGLDATTQLALLAERIAALAKRHSQVFTRDLKPSPGTGRHSTSCAGARFRRRYRRS